MDDEELILALGKVQLENAELRGDGTVKAFLVRPNGYGLGGRGVITHPGLENDIPYDSAQVERLAAQGFLGVQSASGRKEFTLWVTPEGYDHVGLD